MTASSWKIEIVFDPRNGLIATSEVSLKGFIDASFITAEHKGTGIENATAD